MSKITIEIEENEKIEIISYLTLQYRELEKRVLQTQKDIIKEKNKEWKETMENLQKDYFKEINKLVKLINIFKFAK